MPESNDSALVGGIVAALLIAIAVAICIIIIGVVMKLRRGRKYATNR